MRAQRYQDRVDHEINFEFTSDRDENSGAILAIGRSGRETTLWPAQKQFFGQKKWLFYMFKPHDAMYEAKFHPNYHR